MSRLPIIPHSKPWITGQDIASVQQVMGRGMIAQGVLTGRFETAVSRHLKSDAGVACASGTTALVLALQTLGIGVEDEVILPTYVCRNVYEAVVTVGATPVLCDIGNAWVMTASQVEPLISSRTAAVIAVHIFGLPTDIEALKTLNVPIVENACQAFGLVINDRPAGTLGNVGVFSFHATKCLTTGEGGMLISNDYDLVERLRGLRDGTSALASRVAAPMSDLQAALGIAQLERYEQFLRRRRVLVQRYVEELDPYYPIEEIVKNSPFLFRFPVRLKRDSKEIINLLARKRISARLGVDSLIHSQLGCDDRDFPNAVSALKQTLSIPLYPALSDEEIARIIDALIEIINDG